MLQSIAIFKNEIFWVPSSQANAILNLSDSTVKKNELGCKLVQSRLPDPALSCHSQGSALFFHFYFFCFHNDLHVAPSKYLALLLAARRAQRPVPTEISQKRKTPEISSTVLG